MRWVTLYARSRQVPAAFAAMLLGVVGVWWLSGDSWSPFLAALALTSGIAVAAIGLSGQDVDLDRTAAMPWPPRRLAHVLLIGALAGGAVLAVQSLGTSYVDMSIIARDALGLLGLAGIAATVAGGQYGWTLPLAWFAISPLVPPLDPAAKYVAWMLQPAGTPAATWTAVLLGALGVTAYAGWGGRR